MSAARLRPVPGRGSSLRRLSDLYRDALGVLLGIIGPAAAYRLMAVLARLTYRLADPLRAHSEARCRAALARSHSAGAIRRIAAASFVHRAWNLADLLLARRYLRQSTLSHFGGRLPAEMRRLLTQADARAQPVLLVTCYFGPYDLIPLLLGLNGIRATAIYQPHPNPRYDELRNQVRAAGGCRLVPVADALQQLPTVLAQGGVAALLADHAAAHGVAVDFLGRSIRVPRTVGLLAERYGAAVVVAGLRRRAHAFRFDFVVTDVFGPSAWRAAPDAVRYITDRYVHGLQTLVRSAPAQYLWLHDPQARVGRRRSTVAGNVDDAEDE